MDHVLHYADELLLTPVVYPASWPVDSVARQFLSLYVIVALGGFLVYIIPTTLNYHFIFDHNLKKHPAYLPNQVQRELKCALGSIPFMAIPTTLLFLLEVRGYSKLYDDVSDHGGYAALALSCATFLFFTDMAIYWIHRWLHLPIFYKTLHKTHHIWKVPTPFASHAFHPIDGFMQSLPYHVYPFLFPLHKGLYMFLFVAVSVWSVSVHDADYRVPRALKAIVNGSCHHTDHHLKFTCNYGQFFTLWDRLGGTFREPSFYQGDGVFDQLREFENTGTIKKAPVEYTLQQGEDAPAAAKIASKAKAQ